MRLPQNFPDHHDYMRLAERYGHMNNYELMEKLAEQETEIERLRAENVGRDVGWVLVPKEPTKEMLDNTMHNDRGGLIPREYRIAIYRALIAAAPKCGAECGVSNVTPENLEPAQGITGEH